MILSRDGKIDRDAFERGMVSAMRRQDGNSSAAQWILNEVQRGAARWEVREGEWVQLSGSGGAIPRSSTRPLVWDELDRVVAQLQ